MLIEDRREIGREDEGVGVEDPGQEPRSCSVTC